MGFIITILILAVVFTIAVLLTPAMDKMEYMIHELEPQKLSTFSDSFITINRYIVIQTNMETSEELYLVKKDDKYSWNKNIRYATEFMTYHTANENLKLALKPLVYPIKHKPKL